MSNFHVCDRLATVLWRDCRRQAMLSQPRRLLGPVFDDARGHIHVGLDSGSAVLETKFVRQFPSIIPGLLFCR